MAANSVVDLPEPVGPVTSRAPVGRWISGPEPLLHRDAEPDLLDRRRLLGLVEEAHHDRLALDRRQRRDADVEHSARGGRGERDASVLRLPALGDVELREHLQARGDADRAASRDPLGLVEHAVDAEADDERVRLRLEVDVARAVLGRFEDDRVDEPDERGVGDAVVDLEIVDLFLVDHLELGGFAQSRACAERLRRAREPPELVRDVFACRDAQDDRVPAREAQRVDAVDVLRVGDRHAEGVALEGERDGVDLLEDVERQRAGRNGVDADGAELDHRQPVLGGDDARDRLARGEPLVDQHLHDRLVLRLLPENLELRLGNQARRLEEVDDELAHELRDRSGSGRALRRRAPVTGHGRLSRHRSRLMT